MADSTITMTAPDTFVTVCRSLAEFGFVDAAAKMMCASVSAAHDDALLDTTITARIGSRSRTRVMIAAMSGDSARLSQLIRDSRGRSRKRLLEALNLRDADGHTALRLALRRGNVSAVGILLDAGATPLESFAEPYAYETAPTLSIAAISASLPGGLEALALVIASAQKHAPTLEDEEDGAHTLSGELHLAFGEACCPPSDLDAEGRERMKAAALVILRKLDEIDGVSGDTVVAAAKGVFPDVLQAVIDCGEGLIVSDMEPLAQAAGSRRVENVRLLLTRYRELIAAGASDAFGDAYTTEALDVEIESAIQQAGNPDALPTRHDPVAIEAGRDLVEILVGSLSSIDALFDDECGAFAVLLGPATNNPPALRLLLARLAGHPRLLDSLQCGMDDRFTLLQAAACALSADSVRDILAALRRCLVEARGESGAQLVVRIHATIALGFMCNHMALKPDFSTSGEALASGAECARLLLEAGADTLPYYDESSSEQLRNPLWASIRADALEVVQLLLARSIAGTVPALTRCLDEGVKQAALHGSARCLRYLLAFSRSAFPEERTLGLIAAAYRAAIDVGMKQFEGGCDGPHFREDCAPQLSSTFIVLSEEAVSDNTTRTVTLSSAAEQLLRPDYSSMITLMLRALEHAAFVTDIKLSSHLLSVFRVLCDTLLKGKTDVLSALHSMMQSGYVGCATGERRFQSPGSTCPAWFARQKVEDYGKLAAMLARMPEWDQPASSAAEIMASSFPRGRELLELTVYFDGANEVSKIEAVRDAFRRGIKLGLGEDPREREL